jgi:signal recognition particle receptor subunit beta
MRLINGQLYFKILFFGTALAGKTTTLQWVYQNLIPGDMKTTPDIRSVKTSFGQTMLFDFVPIQISEKIHIRLFTATGQDYYAGTRKMLFQDIDGVFLVIDSQKQELEHNQEFIEEFHRHVKTYFNSLDDLTTIVLYNKQDMEDIYSGDFLANELGLENLSGYETNAVSGTNLKKAFTEMIQNCLEKINSFA